jgi:hypothetical protein
MPPAVMLRPTSVVRHSRVNSPKGFSFGRVRRPLGGQEAKHLLQYSMVSVSTASVNDLVLAVVREHSAGDGAGPTKSAPALPRRAHKK